MEKLDKLKKFLYQDEHKELETDIEVSHFGLMKLLEDIVSESKWCSRKEFRDACDTYKFNFPKNCEIIEGNIED